MVAGSAAATAYLAGQATDRRLITNDYDDLLLWGGLLSRDPRRRRRIGLLVHYTLGVALALAYQVALPALPPLPGWLRGLLFAQAENTILYPGVIVLNAIHPDVPAGRLPSLLTWRYFWVESVRHAAYGIVLGALMDERRGI